MIFGGIQVLNFKRAISDHAAQLFVIDSLIIEKTYKTYDKKEIE